jgi:hypothetical protein
MRETALSNSSAVHALLETVLGRSIVSAYELHAGSGCIDKNNGSCTALMQQLLQCSVPSVVEHVYVRCLRACKTASVDVK